MAKSPTSAQVDHYIKNFPPKTRTILTKFRTLVRKLAPASIENISYGLVGYKLNGKPLVYFGGWKSHIGFYATPAGNAAFKKELSKYKGAKGSVQFPLDQPMPYGLVKKMVQYKVKEASTKNSSGYQKTKPASAKKQSFVKYHNDGSVWAKGTMVNGVMEGNWIWFRKNGTKMRSGSLAHGKQTGKWTTFDSKGKVVKVTNFK